MLLTLTILRFWDINSMAVTQETDWQGQLPLQVTCKAAIMIFTFTILICLPWWKNSSITALHHSLQILQGLAGLLMSAHFRAIFSTERRLAGTSRFNPSASALFYSSIDTSVTHTQYSGSTSLTWNSSIYSLCLLISVDSTICSIIVTSCFLQEHSWCWGDR